MGQNRLADASVLIGRNLCLSPQRRVIHINGRCQSALPVNRPGKQCTADLVRSRIHGDAGKQVFLRHNRAEFFPLRGSITVLPAVIQRNYHIVDDALLHQFDGSNMVMIIYAAAFQKII